MKTYYSKSKSHGFTLIEFLVASSLAVIVIMAASSTYFITRKLGQSAQEKINVQNNLRNAATLITRDARAAGGFGCFSTGGIFSTDVEKAAPAPANTGNFPRLNDVDIAKSNDAIQMDNTSKEGYGVIWTDKLDGINLPVSNGKVSNALIFIYGKDNVGITKLNTNSVTLTNIDTIGKEPLVLSSCANAITLIPTSVDEGNKEIKFNPVALTGEMQTGDLNRLSVSKLYAAAYLVAKINQNDTALLRYEMGVDGKWSDPQILSKNVDNMTVNFAYEQQCVASASIPANSMKFAYSADLKYPNLPALIQLKLSYAGSAQDKYIINAGVRGGNQCATQIEITN